MEDDICNFLEQLCDFLTLGICQVKNKAGCCGCKRGRPCPTSHTSLLHLCQEELDNNGEQYVLISPVKDIDEV